MRTISITIGLLLLAVSSKIQSSPLEFRTFVSGPALWIAEPAGITLYRNDTRSVRGVVLCDTVDNDTILDIVENSKILWALAKSGVYQIDLTTTTIEKLPGEKRGSSGSKLTVDDDYVWAGISDTLWRFDKLGREWFAYPIKSGSDGIRGMYSDYDNVYCVFGATIKIFSTQEEKWRDYPYKKEMSISPAAQFFLDKNALILVDGATIYRYIIDAQSWDAIAATSPIVDMLSQDTVIFYTTNTGAFQYFTQTSVARPLDIPGIADVKCFARMADTLICATKKNYIKYDFMAKSSDNIEAPPGVADFDVRKTLILKDTLIALCPSAIAAYDSKSRLWQSVPIIAGAKKRTTFVWDDDNGAKLTYGRGTYSQLRGSIQQDFLIDSAVASGMYYTMPLPYASLTLHNQFPKGNYLDLFFDNADLSQVPKKGAFYRGAPDDRLESVRIGTNTVDIPQSQTILKPQFEGGTIVVQSKTSLSTRDRRIVKAQAGGGLVTTKTLYEVLPYTNTGLYKITSFKNEKIKKVIVPGSLKVTIDGEEIDSTDFMFVALTGSLSFNRQDLLDPTSVLQINYQVRTVPDSGVGTVEIIPENYFGKTAYSSVTLSPTDWISPQIGVVHVETDSAHRYNLVNFSTPTEIRTSSPALFLKINPEITFDPENKTKAAALALQSRFGDKLSLRFNGLLPDSGFVTTDNLDRGYGYLKSDMDMKIGYDIKKELPVSYYQRDVVSAHGVERRYELSAGSHFQGFPFCDVSLSRNQVDADRCDTLTISQTIADTVDTNISGRDTSIIHRTTTTYDSIANDTLDRNKDKFRIRLYETSSPIVEKLLHINRLNYELSYTGFSSEKEGVEGKGYGSIFYGRGTISPIKRLSLTVRGTYLKNAPGSQYATEYNPSLILQTIDAPNGFDISARNELMFKSLANADSGFSTLRRILNLTVKPGVWTHMLSWIQPLLGFNQTMSCAYNEVAPDFSQLLINPENIVRKVTTYSIGANVFPTNDITFRNDNQFTTSDSTTKYYSFNDVKWWFGDKRFWQTRWEYDRDRPRFVAGNGRDYNRGFTRFTNSWTPWLQTLTGVSANNVKTDTTDLTKFGPDITLALNMQKYLFIRSLMNNHTVNVSWTKNRDTLQSTPDITYALYFRVVVMPNISLSANNSFTFNKGAFTRYNATITGTAIF